MGTEHLAPRGQVVAVAEPVGGDDDLVGRGVGHPGRSRDGRVAGERRLFHVLDDEQAEGRGVSQRAAHHQSAGHRMLALGEGDGAGFRQKPHVDQFGAAEMSRDGGHGQNAGRGGLERAAGDEFDQRDAVDHRAGVGCRAQRRDAGGGGSAGAGGDGFLVFETGLAQARVHVDEAGGERETAAVDGLDSRRHTVTEEAGTEIGDRLALGQQRAFGIDRQAALEPAAVDARREGALR